MTTSDAPENPDSPAETPPGGESADGRAQSVSSPREGFSRRGLFVGAAGSLAVGAIAGIGATLGVTSAMSEPTEDAAEKTHPFYTGSHQAGIRTEPQRYSVFMTFDLTTTLQSDVQVLLATWSAAIAQVMLGRTIGSAAPSQASAVPTDTGEAVDLGPSGLTVTVGLGPGLFDDRFGLASKRPAAFRPIPRLPSDQLDPALTGGDLSLQACAEDPQVAYHAIRDLARMARGTAATKWTLMGFGRASAGPDQETPRNLMGFKDGTRNITTDADYDSFVWSNGEDQSWMAGGTYQVVRKIQMDVEIWDASTVGSQQTVFGREKGNGAPLTGHHEHDTPNFSKRGHDGTPVISPTAHIALAAHEHNDGLKILRRSYNYTDGLNQYGQLDAGLLFIAYMNDPAHFVTIQTKLGAVDRLNEYISHVGSGVFLIPPAPRVGHYIGQDLFS